MYSGFYIIDLFFLLTVLCLIPLFVSYGYAIPYKSLHPQVKLYTTVGEHVHHMITPLGGSI